MVCMELANLSPRVLEQTSKLIQGNARAVSVRLPLSSPFLARQNANSHASKNLPRHKLDACTPHSM